MVFFISLLVIYAYTGLFPTLYVFSLSLSLIHTRAHLWIFQMATPISLPTNPSPSQEEAFVLYLKSLYSNINSSVAYSGPTIILAEIRRQNKYTNVSLRRLKEYLSAFAGYSLHKSRHTSKITRRYVSERVHHSLEMDLMSLERFASFNQDIKYLLVTIDIFSRFVRVVTLTDKRSSSVVAALDKILSSMPILPQKVSSDLGAEFISGNMRQFLKSKGIRQNFARQSTHSVMVERIIRILRILFRTYREENNTQAFVSAIPRLVEIYNGRKHSSLSVPPASVNSYNSGYISDHLYRNWVERTNKPYKYKIHDLVRILLEKPAIGDKYVSNYSSEIFSVSIRQRFDHVNTYELVACDQEKIVGLWYEHELSLVKGKDALHRIDKLLQEEKRGKVVWVLVSWRGFHKSCNSWVKKSDIVDL